MSKINVGDIVYCESGWRKGYQLVIETAYVNLCKLKCVKLMSLTHPRHKWRACLNSKWLALENCKKQSVKRVLCSERNFKLLEQIHGIGCFYHDISPLYEKLCSNPPKFVIFKNMSTKQTLILHLEKATKVLKRIGFESNGDYKPVRVVKPMVKLQFIGEL